MLYNNPNTDGAVIHFKARYDNFIGGNGLHQLKVNILTIPAPLRASLSAK